MSNKPWYESSDNILDLARWMCDQSNIMGELAFSKTSIVNAMYSPRKSDHIWQEYQDSLKPKEPTLSEEIDSVSKWADGLPLNFDWLKAVDDSILGLLFKQAQRIEALEEKVKVGE